MDFFLIEKKGILFNREKSEKILVQNFGGNTALGSVSFVGWVGGWVGGILFFVHTPVLSCPYTRATRDQGSLRSERILFTQL